MMTMSCSSGRSCIAAPSGFGTGAANDAGSNAITACAQRVHGHSSRTFADRARPPAKRIVSMLVVHDEGIERILLEPGAPSEKRELDQEGGPDDHPAESLDELERGRHGAAGGQQIVDREHALAGLDRVLVDGEDVGSVLEG